MITPTFETFLQSLVYQQMPVRFLTHPHISLITGKFTRKLPTCL